jgi:hypothetical protein
MAAALFGCQKDKEPGVTQQEVTFSATLVQPGAGLKSSEAFECKDLTVDYALINIDNAYYYVDVYTVAGTLYTQAIKLDVPAGPAKEFIVSEFYLMHQNGGKDPDPFDPTDPNPDVIVWATPTEGGAYHVYVSDPVNVKFQLDAFQKMEVPIEVLCYQEADFDDFGFFWFDNTEIVIREQCFFGDLCIKHLADYTGSPYAGQSHGLQIDMPAIMKLVVKDEAGNQVPYSPFLNIGWLGEGQPLCIEYPDDLSVDGETFTVELYILVKVGDGFDYVKFHVWTFDDEEMIPAGTDGVVDIVLGACNLTAPDLQLPPYQNLPLNGSVNFSYPGNPGYWTVKVLTVNPTAPAGGYDIPVSQDLAGWCGDNDVYLTPGTHDVYFYGSLSNHNWPPDMPFTLGKIAQVNWLFNNLGLYSMNILALTDPQGDIIQNAVWELLCPNFTATGQAMTMATAALSHSNYVPLPGGWAAVLMAKDGQPMRFQLIFTIVDP